MTELTFDSEMHVELKTLSFEVNEDGRPLKRSLDLIPVNAARVSVKGESEEFSPRDAGLLNRLVNDRHGTPFEHGTIGFRISVPIFVERQWRTHRWSSFNEMSGRYTEILPVAYVPEVLHTEVGKSMDYHRAEIGEYENGNFLNDVVESYHQSWAKYTRLLDMKVSKEEARIVLPVGMYTSFYWTANLRSIMNFLSLRNEEHAQYEIRSAAGRVEYIFSKFFPATYESFINAGRSPVGA